MRDYYGKKSDKQIMDNGRYEILSGHNRAYAAGQAGLTAVPAVVNTDISDKDAEIYVVETNLI